MIVPTVYCSQQSEFDCVLACLTMAVGRPYAAMWPQEFRDAVEQAKGTGKDGLHEKAFDLALLVRDQDYVSVYCPPDHAEAMRRMLWGRRALVQVPSLNYEGASHYVYWDGWHVQDPSTKQRYRWLSQLALEWVSLLR